MLSQIGVRRLVGRIAREFGQPAPPVSFEDGPWSYHNSGRILMSSPAWAKEHKAATATGYRLLVLHEMAHYLFGPGHDSFFYYNLFSLCRLYEVPLALAISDELKYKPRAARQGVEAYLAHLEGDHDEAHRQG